MAFPGIKIGLLGGSFNPAHDGHRRISLIALRRLGLDRVWWLVSPRNPLKSPDEYSDYDQRLTYARAVADHPRICVSDFERRRGLRYTHETLNELRSRHRGVHFVWLMGGDNLSGFHLWARWRRIAQTMPIAVFSRPGTEVSAPFSPAARYLANARLDSADAKLLALRQPPAWIYLTETLHPASSTAIRRQNSAAAAPSRTS